MKITTLLVLIAVLLAAAASAPSVMAAGETTTLDGSGWRIAPQAEVAATGEAISQPGYLVGDWVRAQVPGTVFGSYVNDHLEPEPTYGDNAYKVNPVKYNRNFWYRTNFAVPNSDRFGSTWLNFGGVNRDADVYVNGRKVGSLLGFMQRGRFDVTDLVHPGGVNVLAVLDHVPVLVAGQVNSSSPSFICSQGWDWMPPVPGLNMGIYKDVFLSHTGPVSILDPWMRTVALPSRALAELSFQTDLENASAQPISGILSGMIEPGHRAFSVRVFLAAGQTRTLTLTSADAPALRIVHPRLWWPNGYGTPNLSTCRLAFHVGTQVSDATAITFGIRKYTYDTDNGILHFHINGVRLFPKGGSWGMAEFMLRCHGADYDTRVRFHRDMHFNMIRNWMGMTPDDAFYAACDKYGIMVWDEFWLNSGGSVPANIPVYNANVIEKIKTFRNHPCIALWCAENEGTPPEPLNSQIRADVQTYDHGDRYYQPNSHAGDLSGSGPWHDLPPKQYFIGVPTWGDGGPYGMRSEIGTATFTNVESFKKFMPRADWWPRNPMWDKHFFGPSATNAGPDGYYADVTSRYGRSSSIQEFCAKAQLLNLETMKAMFEGWLDHSDRDASGILIWMSQSAFPSFVWQTYDYYYDTTGAFWGARNACEPIHIYWNQNDDQIRVVNTSGHDADGLTAQGWLFNLDGTQKWHKAVPVNSHFGHIADCFRLSFPRDLSPTHFIRLRLTDRAGKIVSENFYWRGTTYLDYSALDTMKPVSLAVGSHLARAGHTETITATVTNPLHSGTVALAIRPLVVDARTGAEILPVFMNDGCFSLLPGETKRLTIRFSAAAAAQKPKLVVQCWNNIPKTPRPTRRATGDLALFQPVTASSNDGYAAGPGAAVDGDPTTRWSSAWGSDPQWICIDLGKPEDIRRVRLLWETAYASSYEIQVSDDDKTWTSIYQTTTGQGGTEDLTGLHGRGRYIRLYATKRATMFGVSLYEFEVFGPGAVSGKRI